MTLHQIRRRWQKHVFDVFRWGDVGEAGGVKSSWPENRLDTLIRSLFTKATPTSYGAITDVFIVYPWEIDRGVDPILARQPMMG